LIKYTFKRKAKNEDVKGQTSHVLLATQLTLALSPPPQPSFPSRLVIECDLPSKEPSPKRRKIEESPLVDYPDDEVMEIIEEEVQHEMPSPS